LITTDEREIKGSILILSPRDEDENEEEGTEDMSEQNNSSEVGDFYPEAEAGEDDADENEDDEGDGDCRAYFGKKLASGELEYEEAYQADSGDDDLHQEDRYTVTYSLYSQSDGDEEASERSHPLLVGGGSGERNEESSDDDDFTDFESMILNRRNVQD
jgi:hypothetical protein